MIKKIKKMSKEVENMLKKVKPIRKDLGIHSFVIGIAMIVNSTLMMTKDNENDIVNDIEYKNFVTGLMAVNILSVFSILLRNRKEILIDNLIFFFFYLAFSAWNIWAINQDKIKDINLLKIVTVSQTVVTIFNIPIYGFCRRYGFL